MNSTKITVGLWYSINNLRGELDSDMVSFIPYEQEVVDVHTVLADSSAIAEQEAKLLQRTADRTASKQTLDLSSSRIQMAALGHTSTPFCFVIRQLLGFFPGQVHLSEVPFDDIYSVLPRSSWLSLVTSQFPLCCLTSCSTVVHSQDVSQPPEPSFFNYIFQFPWTSFVSDVFISDLVPPCDPQQSPLELMVNCF